MIEILYNNREAGAHKVIFKALQKTAKAKIHLTRSADFQIFSNFLESY